MQEPLRKLGPYTLIKKIGRGGFGVVWLAEKQNAIATTRFALKLPREEDILEGGRYGYPSSLLAKRQSRE
jgi:hypothetical protein